MIDLMYSKSFVVCKKMVNDCVVVLISFVLFLLMFLVVMMELGSIKVFVSVVDVNIYNMMGDVI